MIYNIFFLQLLASCIKSYSHVRNNHKFDSIAVYSYMKKMYKKTTKNTYLLILVVPRFLHGGRVVWNNNSTANFQTPETKPLTISTEHTFFYNPILASSFFLQNYPILAKLNIKRIVFLLNCVDVWRLEFLRAWPLSQS